MSCYFDSQNLRILLVKTSSLGDVLHNMPVATDIMRHFPNAKIDWVVEESFVSLPRLHPAVRKVIPVAVRRWRNKLFKTDTWREIFALRNTIGSQHYDYAIDTQGLIKSALLMRFSSGLRCGFDKNSAREPSSVNFYQRTFSVAKEQHAVERNRQLAAQALGYRAEGKPVYGICVPAISHTAWHAAKPYVVLLHATSRTDKLWSESNWIALGCYLSTIGLACILPWGSKVEHMRSIRISNSISGAVIPPPLSLDEISSLLGGAEAVIGVDTGLAHLATALGVSTVGIYTATDPTLTGLYAGKSAVNLGNIGQSPEVSDVIDALKRITAC